MAKADTAITKAGDGKTPAPIQKVAATAEVDAMLAESRKITEQDFYEVERYDKRRNETVKVKKPGARALQYEANKSGFGGISTKIIEAGIDEDHGWARVQGWPKNDPAFVKEEQVTIFFEFEFAQLLMDRIKNGCKLHKGGCPIVKEGNQPVLNEKTGLPMLQIGGEQLQLITQMLRVKKFADRTCITKCEARLHEKFLHMEWREPEEIDHEFSEVEIVNQSRKAETASEMAPAKNKEQTKEATPPLAKKEPPKQAPKAKETSKPPQEENSGIPKANIPPPPQGGPAPATEEPKKTIQDRAARLALVTASSNTHVVTFFLRQLQVDDLKKAKKEDVEKILAACEATIASGIVATEFGAFIRGDNAPPAVAERFNQMMGGN